MDLWLLPHYVKSQIPIPVHLILVQEFPLEFPAKLCKHDAKNQISHSLAKTVARSCTEGPESSSVVTIKDMVILCVVFRKPSLRLEHIRLAEVFL